MQISMFDGLNRFVIDKPIRLIELFAGIGSQAKALKNLGVDFEHYRICEFDKYAVQSYNAVHGTNFKTSDITKIKAEDLGITDTDKFCYIMTYSFPCQDLSNAGKQAGMAKGSGTRSGLLWEVERLLDECKELPQVLILENVPQIISQANIEHFAKWVEKLESLGYKNKWQILNAKDFGIPQNRERCFMVSILGDYYYEFPKTIPLKLRLKDMLEVKVDEKYYLSDSTIERISKWKAQQDPLKDIEKEKVISPCLTARGAGEEHSGMVLISEPKHEELNLKRELCNNLVKNNLVEEGDVIRHSYTKSRMQGDMKDIKEKGLCPTLDTRCDCLGVTVNEPVLLAEGGKIVKENKKQIASTLQAHLSTGITGFKKQFDNGVVEYSDYSFYRIRKLTPKECWRLMGFEDKDIEKAITAGMSDTQLYRQAGNSIVVNVLMAIFEKMI